MFSHIIYNTIFINISKAAIPIHEIKLIYILNPISIETGQLKLFEHFMVSLVKVQAQLEVKTKVEHTLIYNTTNTIYHPLGKFPVT